MPLSCFLAGLLICPLVVGFCLVVAARRMAQGDRPFFKIEIVNAPLSEARLGLARAAETGLDPRPDLPPHDEEVAGVVGHEPRRPPGVVVDLADGEIPLPLAVSTYADQQREQQEQDLEREQAIFDQIIEQNEALQRQLEMMREQSP